MITISLPTALAAVLLILVVVGLVCIGLVAAVFLTDDRDGAREIATATARRHPRLKHE